MRADEIAMEAASSPPSGVSDPDALIDVPMSVDLC